MKISIQTGGLVNYRGLEEGYRLIREAGFEAIDWNIDSAWDSSQFKKKQLPHCIFEDSLEDIHSYYREELEVIRKNGLEIWQAHAPFPPYVQGFPELNEYAIGVYKQCIRFCAGAGVRYLVVHGISHSVNDDTQTPESIRRMNLHLYESLIPVLAETELVVCLENLFISHEGHMLEGVCARPEEACGYIDYLNEKAGKECFALCLDTGHLNLVGKRQKPYILELGKRIRALHLHDNGGMQDEHLAPYTGNILWRDVVDGLAEIGYDGSLNFETFRQISPYRMEKEMVPVWLRTIYETGCVFRTRIEAAQGTKM